ncbi:polygalacturonase-like [Elaeis guineensis]|uniref:polygalacturonase-like n=1 Tax=Elaeis guineensis var. tenera TaxID=51953 RepID=UPI003C6D8D4D
MVFCPGINRRHDHEDRHQDRRRLHLYRPWHSEPMDRAGHLWAWTWHKHWSLGKGFDERGTENVTVKTAVFTGTENGLRIKTWGRPSDGFVKGVVFEHALMQNVRNPIIIDQNYCPEERGCPEQNSGIKISQVTYSDIQDHLHHWDSKF